MLARLRSASIALNTRKIVKHSTLILKSSKFKLKTSRVVLKNVIFQSCPLILKKSVDPRVMICSVLGLETKKSKDNVEEMCLFAIKVDWFSFWLKWNFETCCKFSIKMIFLVSVHRRRQLGYRPSSGAEGKASSCQRQWHCSSGWEIQAKLVFFQSKIFYLLHLLVASWKLKMKSIRDFWHLSMAH